MKTYQANSANPEDLAYIETEDGETVILLPNHKHFGDNFTDYDILKAFEHYFNFSDFNKKQFEQLFNEVKTKGEKNEN